MDIHEFTNLLRKHAGLIHKVSYAYCRDATDREDLIQEIAMQLWRSQERYDARFKETTWIYRIAINVAISFYRREQRHQKGRTSLEGSALTIAAPSVEYGEEVERLMRCIDDLNEFEKAIVLLYLDGHDHSSIAEVLGISVSNVGTKLHRIKSKLRVAFDQRNCSYKTEKPHATQ